ncbi:UPF0236 family transposase-like protein [Clostridium sp. cel8]|jgi:hypothetical protein|uniref:UPF0236 family transposase-like protein n=1 Tax=unclassified Clostridium TaxID=2614128 RepID=UPI001FAD560F|nr:UPF0236 family protein [Clostridium sp. cel8]
MYNLSLKDNDITFNNLEKKIYKYVCNKACEFMKEVLTHLDRRLMDERDSKIYRNKGLRSTCIKTIMGNIEFKRRMYEFKTEDGKRPISFY